MGVDVLRALERAGYECFVPLERKSCFDIAARSHKQVLFIKALSNIDSLREEQARDLMALANSLGATALLVGERSKAYELEDGLVYERYGLQCVTTSTLERVLGGVMPDKEFNKGRVVARIDEGALEKKMGEAGASAIAETIHVTREAVYGYRKSLRMDYTKAVELEHAFHTAFIKAVDLFHTTPMHTVDLSGYLKRLGELGFSVVPVHKGFDAIAREKEALIVDAATPALARRKAEFLGKAGEFFQSEPVFVSPGKAPTAVKGVPMVTEKEISDAASPGDVIDLVKRRRKA